MLKRLAQSFREMRTLKRGHPQFKKCKKHKGMTFSGEQVAIEKVSGKQKQHRNHPTYKIRLNGHWYRFALHRAIEGDIQQVHVTRDALGDMYITLTEDYSEVRPEPKTGKAEGFDMGIKDFLTGSDGERYTSPMFYKQNAKKLATAQKALSRKAKGSGNQERERKNAAMNILKEGVASFGLGVVSPIVLFNKIVGYSVEATSRLLKSTSASA